jgi:hypothetical protein
MSHEARASFAMIGYVVPLLSLTFSPQFWCIVMSLEALPGVPICALSAHAMAGPATWFGLSEECMCQVELRPCHLCIHRLALL